MQDSNMSISTTPVSALSASSQTINPHRAKELRKKARSIATSVRIGKNGVTESVVLEIQKIIKIKKLVKIKLLQSFSSEKDRHETAESITTKTGAVLVQVIGNTIVLYKK